MNDRNKKKDQHSQTRADDEEWPEKMPLSEARKYLGISEAKMTSLISNGVLKYEQDLLDHRVKLVKRDALEELLRKRTIDE